jgi:hypothetical protein
MLNHPPVEDRSTNHRFGLDIDHDFLREHPDPRGMRERPINTCDLACADHRASPELLYGNVDTALIGIEACSGAHFLGAAVATTGTMCASFQRSS